MLHLSNSIREGVGNKWIKIFESIFVLHDAETAWLRASLLGTAKDNKESKHLVGATFLDSSSEPASLLEHQIYMIISFTGYSAASKVREHIVLHY